MSMKSESENSEQKFDLYNLLKVDKSANPEQIKKAYKKLALLVHPDKNKENPEQAKEDFQKINAAYQILSNPEKRKIYDETGCIDDANYNMDDFQKFYEAMRKIYKKIEISDIELFEQKYRFSKEEEQDLIDFYNQKKGDISEMLMSIPCSYNSDIDRFIEFYEKCINEKKIKKYKKFDTSQEEICLLEDQSDLIKEMEEEEKQQMGEQSLIQMIQNKKSNFGSVLNSLEDKYGKKKKKSEYDIDDDEFEKLQKEIFSKKNKKIKKK